VPNSQNLFAGVQCDDPTLEITPRLEGLRHTQGMHITGALAALFLMAPVLVSCAEGGDCSARVLYQGTVYLSHQDLRDRAPEDRSVGRGEVLGCGDLESAERVAEVSVHSLQTVPVSVAIMVSDSQWRGIFVSEDIPPSEWPDVIRLDSERP
jgi:hypothetical protein